MNAKLVLHELRQKLNTDGHITEADVEEARLAAKALGGADNIALYSLLKRRIEVPAVDEDFI